jgi:hypothetical protein
MKKLSIVLAVLFPGMNVNAQNAQAQSDTAKILQEVTVIAIAKKRSRQR